MTSILSRSSIYPRMLHKIIPILKIDLILCAASHRWTDLNSSKPSNCAMSNKITSFQRHIAHFNTTSTGIITPFQSLKTFLSVGFDFPVALVSAFSLPLRYGNCGFLSLNIDVAKIPPAKQPSQLESVSMQKESYDRSEFLALLKDDGRDGWLDRLHMIGYWTMAAATQGSERGRIGKEDIEAIQEGVLMKKLQQRRRDRHDVLPLWRGGPISCVYGILIWPLILQTDSIVE